MGVTGTILKAAPSSRVMITSSPLATSSMSSASRPSASFSSTVCMTIPSSNIIVDESILADTLITPLSPRVVEGRTLGLSRACQPQRGTSEGWQASAAGPAFGCGWRLPVWPLPCPCVLLLDQLIRQDEECRGERDPECLRRLAVEDQLELR